MTHRSNVLALGLCASLLCGGCGSEGDRDVGSRASPIVDVPQTPVEQQAIGNCWLYAQASWIESMHLSATGQRFDTSESYWSYWHWFDQISRDGANEIATGGNQEIANRIVAQRGLVREADFVPSDTVREISEQQASALDTIHQELVSGRLSGYSARGDGALIRQVLDDAWKLSTQTRRWLDAAFGADGSRVLAPGTANVPGTPILSPGGFGARYTERLAEKATVKTENVSRAMAEWHTEHYPSDSGGRRDFLVRVQRAMHDRQAVLLTWDVDFNALESGDNARRGSFNMTTLRAAGGPGHQGGHMVVLEDYQATTDAFGLLAAGVTLDPARASDKARLDAALLPSTEIQFLRVKNSWGTLRADRGTVPGFPGYHDLYMDYLNGPIAWCPDSWSCHGSSVPLKNVVLPPGY